jgi:hypothetical protein
MEGERGGGQAQPLADLSGSHSVRPGLNEQPEHIEAGFLREGRQGDDGA